MSASGGGALHGAPTLLASDADKGGPNSIRGSGSLSVPAFVARLPTITVYGNYNRKGSSKKSGDGLATALARLPTLMAGKGLDGGSGARRALKKYGTLTAACSHTDRSPEFSKGRSPTPMEAAGGPLNPTWAEWFMGWPIGATELRDLEMGKFRSAKRPRGTSSVAR